MKRASREEHTMSQSATLWRSPRWMVAAAAALVASLLLVVLLLPGAAFAALGLGAGLIGTLALGQARALRRPAKVRPVARAALQPAEQRTIYSPDGAERRALVVQGAQTDGYELVLTVEGYALVDEFGKIVYRLRQ
jgi:hypothetical protein